jgi:hypothetical protein
MATAVSSARGSAGGAATWSTPEHISGAHRARRVPLGGGDQGCGPNKKRADSASGTRQQPCRVCCGSCGARVGTGSF